MKNWQKMIDDIHKEKEIKTHLDFKLKTNNNLLLISKWSTPIWYLTTTHENFNINSLKHCSSYPPIDANELSVYMIGSTLYYGCMAGEAVILSKCMRIGVDNDINSITDNELENIFLKRLI